MNCPLCSTSQVEFYTKDKRRDYYICCNCSLVFVPTHQRLSAEEEKNEYDKHENSPDDIGYRKFLSRITLPINNIIPQNSYGLDFGCGPGPTLSVMLEEAGHSVDNYDIFYHNDNTVFNNKYDFITCTEVFEHLFNPGKVLNQLFSILKKNGTMGIMTKRVTNKEAFQAWHYKNDQTHVIFFSEKTFNWIGEKYQRSVDFVDKDVVLLY